MGEQTKTSAHEDSAHEDSAHEDSAHEDSAHEDSAHKDAAQRDTAIEAARLATLLPAVIKSFYTSALSISIFSALLFRFSPVGLSIWLGIRIVVSAGCLVTLKRLSTASTSVDKRRSIIVATLGLSGVVWGLIPIFVQPPDPEWRAIVVLWLFGNQSVITAVCSPSQAAFRMATGTVTLIGALSVASTGDSFGLVLGALLLLGGVYSSSISVAIHRVVTTAIEAQFETVALATSLTQRQGELEAANRELDELASRDGLTRLPNRRSFTDAVADGSDQIRRTGWLGFIDLDHFKTINDTYGHAMGDLVLMTVANRWSPLLPARAVLARTGGDEFALFVDGGSEDDMIELCERLNQSLGQAIEDQNGSGITASCSIGVARALAGEQLSNVMARADAVLYEVKSGGRGSVRLPADSRQKN